MPLDKSSHVLSANIPDCLITLDRFQWKLLCSLKPNSKFRLIQVGNTHSQHRCFLHTYSPGETDTFSDGPLMAGEFSPFLWACSPLVCCSMRTWFFFFFLGPHPRHMEVPRLGVELATAAGLHHSHSNMGSKPRGSRQPMVWVMATYTRAHGNLDTWPTEQGQGLNLCPHGY